MTTKFLFQGLEIDEGSQQYIVKRLDRIQKLADAASVFEVEVDRDKKGKFRVEIMIRSPKKRYRAEEITESIEGSVDLVIDELEQQMTKEKDRTGTLVRRGGRSIKKKMTLDSDARF